MYTKEDKKDIGEADDKAEPSPVLGDPRLHGPLVELPLKLKHVCVGAKLLIRDGLEGGEYFGRGGLHLDLHYSGKFCGFFGKTF